MARGMDIEAAALHQFNRIGARNVTIGDRAHQFNGFVRRQIDLHDRRSFPDVQVRRRWRRRMGDVAAQHKVSIRV
jgi:hypothetical protein